jgi:hypothetical protein
VECVAEPGPPQNQEAEGEAQRRGSAKVS